MTTKTKEEMILLLAAELKEWPKNIRGPIYDGWVWACDYRDVIYLRGTVLAGVISERDWSFAKPTPPETTLSHLITIRIASLVTTGFLAEAEVIIGQAIEDWDER